LKGAARCSRDFGSHKVKFKFLEMRMKTLVDGVAGAYNSIVYDWVFFNIVHFQDLSY
jgi:hypothetical protein